MKFENPDVSLESLLRSTSLREPSDALDARVDAVFATYRFRQPRRFQFYLMALAAGLLLAIGVGVYLASQRKPALPAMVAIAAKPGAMQIERDTSTVYDDGIIASTGTAAYQQYRRRTVREIWYVNPTTHARMVVTIPTEQVLIQKVEAF